MSFLFIALWGISIANANPELVLLEQQHPQEYSRLMSLTPIPTRAGHLRFVGSELANAKWAPLYLKRYTSGKESTAVRSALLDLIHRSLGALPEEVTSSYSQEPEKIRASILDMTEFGIVDPEQAQKDSSPLVRAAFIRQVAKSPQASNQFVINALQDDDVMVLADAARAAHQKECTEGIPYLANLVIIQDNVVALRALYALSKLDLPYARTLVQQHNLMESPYKNLALFAKRL